MIVNVGGTSIRDVEAYYGALRGVRPGDTVDVRVMRERSEVLLNLTMGARGHSLEYTALIKRLRVLHEGAPSDSAPQPPSMPSPDLGASA